MKINMTKEAKIIFSITMCVVIAVVILMIISPKQMQPAQTAVDMTHVLNATSHMTGTTTAKVTIVEFGDYECPACAEVNSTMDQIVAIYGKNPNFNFVFRNFPLPQHNNAQIAAEAAEAAGAQGKFWQMHDLLYANQNDWVNSTTPIDFFVQYATTLGLDTVKFKEQVLAGKYADFINADQNDGNAINVQWTPSIYINGVLQQQTPTLDQFKTQIDTLLAQ
jgi:protein-disulfide isomerase